jgi:uncharacterized protein YndB with AHSA1/START domain
LKQNNSTKKVNSAIQFEVSDVIPANPEVVFSAWLNSEEHSLMTGAFATVSANIGEPFEAWDGYIQGKNLELDPPMRILQSWRTSEFSEDEEDSRLEVLLDPVTNGTRITIHHSNLPQHGMQYKQGWIDSYFEPMKTYFSSKSG